MIKVSIMREDSNLVITCPSCKKTHTRFLWSEMPGIYVCHHCRCMLPNMARITSAFKSSSRRRECLLFHTTEKDDFYI